MSRNLMAVSIGSILASLFLSLVSATATSPQQLATATLSGRVADQTGAIISGAQIQITNRATGARRETATNADGLFTVTNLAPGLYEISIVAPGFAEKNYRDIQLRVGQTLTLEIALDVPRLQEEVVADLSEPAQLVNTTGSVIDGVISSAAIENLPLNGRNFLELALLAPGNAPAPNFDPTKTNTVEISSAGQLGRGGNVTVDGADNNDDVVGGPLQNISQEAVQEFQIATSRFSAELGRSGSSIINIVTKSGTNEIHGAGSFFWRDDKLQGLPATFDRSSGQKPPFDREQYAVALGGPFVRNCAWWFGSVEYRDQNGAVLVGTRDVTRRTIVRSFAPAPLNDLLVTERNDWHPSDRDQLSFRYSYQRASDVAASTLIRAIGSASQRQKSRNIYHSLVTNWTHIISPTAVNNLTFSESNFFNRIQPLQIAPQLTFPSLQDGASFRVPQQTTQNRLQFANSVSWTRGTHALHFGGEIQRVDAGFDLGVFRQGRIELIEDFPAFDRNSDGRVDDDDLLFAITLRSATPDRDLAIPDADNTYLAFFIQDDWQINRRLTLNLGLRYELDTDVKNVSRFNQLNPLILPFVKGPRRRDTNNWGPRFGFNWSTSSGRTSVHGGYGIYYDRVTLELQSLERGLDGRSLVIEVRAGNLFYLDPITGRFPPFAPTLSNPFTGFILPGAGAGGINIIDSGLQNPMVQQMNLGLQHQIGDILVRADYLHALGTHFIIGREIGTVFNPVVGGPDRVVNLESSVKTKYDGLLLSVERRSRRNQFRASYTLSKAFNYANDDQIPFSIGPIDPNNLRLEYGPTPNDQRHRFTFAGTFELPRHVRLSSIWTLASGVPMDILMPDGLTRIPVLQRNAGGRLFHTGAELNAFIRQINASGGINGQLLPLVSDGARFNDSFNSLDLRLSKSFKLSDRASLEPMVEVFNLFNVTNVLGVSNVNYSGFANVLSRDNNDPASPGYLRSSSFGRPVTTAGGVFGSGGPRAFQLAVRFAF